VDRPFKLCVICSFRAKLKNWLLAKKKGRRASSWKPPFFFYWSYISSPGLPEKTEGSFPELKDLRFFYKESTLKYS